MDEDTEEMSKITKVIRKLDNPKGEDVGREEKRMMGFGEYHLWPYESVLRERSPIT